MNPALFDPTLPPLPVPISLLLSCWQTQIQINVQRGLSTVSHLIPSQPPNLQLSYRSLLCFSLQVLSLSRRSWTYAFRQKSYWRGTSGGRGMWSQHCQHESCDTLWSVQHWWPDSSKLFHIPNGDHFSQRTVRAEVDSLLSLMLISTVFRWGLSSSSISSRPRTLIAPSALFRLSVQSGDKDTVTDTEKWALISSWHQVKFLLSFRANPSFFSRSNKVFSQTKKC